jgi:hypothetical protein
VGLAGEQEEVGIIVYYLRHVYHVYCTEFATDFSNPVCTASQISVAKLCLLQVWSMSWTKLSPRIVESCIAELCRTHISSYSIGTESTNMFSKLYPIVVI